ncbi:hypothetical protein BDZ97DRAFT_2072165 [Flammula alnicola]|nr:hypothetical protein BDZ97DRAFT_2072165 [Flammula alnicola]
MVKFASSLLIATLIAVPAFAQANWDDLDTRDLSETELFGRELTDAEFAVLAREIDELYARFPEEEMLATREMEDLVERSKIGRKIGNFFKKIWHGIKKVASIILRREEGAEDEVFARYYEEVDARDLDELYQRYIEEIEERTPGFFSFMKDGMKHVKQIAHSGEALAAQPSAPANEVREFDDLAERDFFDEDMYERDLDLNLDLSERDFEDELSEREFDEELQERDLEEELSERDYPEEDLYEREFEEEDLLERQYYDDLD